jgi:hypothetical protein
MHVLNLLLILERFYFFYTGSGGGHDKIENTING